MQLEFSMIREIEIHQSDLIKLCKRYGVRQLQLFGSAATGAFEPATSDLDFLAEFENTRSADYADRYLDFAEALERLFNRSVDVLTQGSIRNPYFRAEVERTAQVIYEDHAQEATV
jgi:predicted nucleotidyltransferase